MKNLFILFALLGSLMSCQKKDTDPLATGTGNLTNRSVLIYTTNLPGAYNYPGTYQVTEYDANGIPTLAKTSVNYTSDISPNGTYTSTIKLDYDPLLRLKKTVQTFHELGYPSCCPGSPPYTDPDRQLINEYEYQGNTANITHEISYTVNAKKGEKAVVSERFRTFTDHGLLTQEKLGAKTLYEATYDEQDNPLIETLFDDTGIPISRTWANAYDANQHLVSRKIKGSDSFETNTYDSQGRLLRRVTNMMVSTPFKPGNDMGRLIDYRFARLAERSEMTFMYFKFTQQWTHDLPHVLTYEYIGEEIQITNTTYSFWTDVPEVAQPGFDFSQVSNDQLSRITVTKWRLNKWNKLASEAFTHTYISPKLAPEQRGAGYSSDNTYVYDEAGNLVSTSGGYTNFSDMIRNTYASTFAARYKNF